MLYRNNGLIRNNGLWFSVVPYVLTAWSRIMLTPQGVLAYLGGNINSLARPFQQASQSYICVSFCVHFVNTVLASPDSWFHWDIALKQLEVNVVLGGGSLSYYNLLLLLRQIIRLNMLQMSTQCCARKTSPIVWTLLNFDQPHEWFSARR